MSFLYEKFFEPCVLLEKKRIPGTEGGWTTTYEEGTEFSAAIVQNSSTLAEIAEAQGTQSVYHIYTAPENALDFHDVIKRKKDGVTFRVTGEAKDTPAVASFEFSKVNAEKWEVST